jgi:hypothetical protein
MNSFGMTATIFESKAESVSLNTIANLFSTGGGCCWTFYVLCVLAFPTILWTLLYVSNNVYMKIMGPVDVKKKYNAKWALVTGAGTGIGRSLSFALAEQGLNVVLVSMKDKANTLKATTNALKKKYPKLKFRPIEAHFHHEIDYMPAIIEGTEDIDVQVINNKNIALLCNIYIYIYIFSLLILLIILSL